jgi:hypothetical protein
MVCGCGASHGSPGDLAIPDGGGADLGTAPLPGADLAALPGADLASPPVAVPDLAAPDLAPVIGTDATVTLFDHVLFSWDGQHNNRESRAGVNLPDGAYSRITLHLALDCPGGGCDPYDRLSTIGIVEGSGSAEQIIEVGRFATPFGIGGAWDIDVTDLAPLLAGARTVRGAIDTWVGNGQGWLLTAQLVYVGGLPKELPVAVLPLSWGNFNIGDPAHPVAAQLPPQSVTLPPGVTHAAVRLTVSGHGQGNRLDCAEFCSLQHTLSVDKAIVGHQQLWRSDCDQNPVQPQNGTWQYARAGWCPGADVKPWRIDLGAHAGPFTLGYAIDSYVNTCSPGPLCNTADCTLGNSCDYDGGNHTPPFYAFSAVVIAYR